MNVPKLTPFTKRRRPIGASFRHASNMEQGRGEEEEDEEELDVGVRPDRQYFFSNTGLNRSEDEGGTGRMRNLEISNNSSIMQTLDRRISVSTDQIDTLRREKKRRRPVRSRSSYRQIRPELRPRKTPFEMFLEDDGPYSRKLYGPVQTEEIEKEEEKKKEERKHSKLSETRIQDHTRIQDCEDMMFPAPRAVKRGMLWQHRDKIFSRWKQRYFILTQDYLYCYRRDTAHIGGFVFKVMLSDIENLELVDKRGNLIVIISQFRDSKIFLRTTFGLQDWYNVIQAAVYESKKRKTFWVSGQEHSHNTPEKPHLTTTPVNNNNNNNSNNNYTNGNSKYTSSSNNYSNKSPSNLDGMKSPRGINRITLVTDLLKSEVDSGGNMHTANSGCNMYTANSGGSMYTAHSGGNMHTANSGGNMYAYGYSGVDNTFHDSSGKTFTTPTLQTSNVSDMANANMYKSSGPSLYTRNEGVKYIVGGTGRVRHSGEGDSGLESVNSLNTSSDSQSELYTKQEGEKRTKSSKVLPTTVTSSSSYSPHNASHFDVRESHRRPLYKRNNIFTDQLENIA